MLGSLLQPEIQELIANNKFNTIREIFSEWQPADLAELISELHKGDRLVVFRVLPGQLAHDTFEHLDVEVQIKLIKSMGQGQVADILNNMSPDDRTALLEELPVPVIKQLLLLLTREERLTAQLLLGYPENSIGRLMTPDYIAVDENFTMSEVQRHIRKYGKDSESINMIYVVDEKGILIDDIKIRQVMLEHPSKKIKSVMDNKFTCVNVLDDEETVISVCKKYNLYSIPVVNSSGYLLGIITIDDVLDVAVDGATEDIQKIGGMEALEEPYIRTSILKIIRKRALWLIVLFLGETLTASTMGYYENEISRVVILALFIPLIISSGGNSGSQATTLIIRSLAIGEVTLRDWWRVMKREAVSGLTLGLILGAVGFIRITIWQKIFHIYGIHWLLIGLTVGLTLVGVVMWGTLLGSMLPFILKRMKLDPATASAPFVATLVDVLGLVIYFNIAYYIMKGTLL